MGIGKLLHYGKKKKASSPYPTFNRRMMAVTIDSVVLLLFLPLINRLAPLNREALSHYTVDEQDSQAATHFLQHVLGNTAFMQSWISNFMMQMLFWCVYSAICLHFWSATPGKIIMRMKVVDSKNGGRISDMQVFLRSFGYMVSAVCLGLGFLWINFNKRRRGWHDYLGDTVVIATPLWPWKKAVAAAPIPPETTEQDNA